ncbi:MAG: universal stress protein [Ignavibacteriales bacterium]|jgi:Universal stress protein UspA and related nucleotide-binding proteins|nr:MAG: universal stress protein [Ignavibacteriaceae bacterium]MBW7874093.1 universal stress protein [Ignavibacteria bacterium]MCZ2143193.1 universal stress protein [Ignavibacteriales bacterium]MBV6444073.1 TRAP-T-associated universal stress protein TeaD [Ignavibacteriaceae bacterium]MBZ0196076.1 universal stress protein [Ignavibacteriaceae bacterium]
MAHLANLKQILFPTDFSKYSMAAAEYAVDRAKKYGATIHVLHVVEDFKPILAIRTFDLTQEKIENEMTEQANRQLEECIKDTTEKFGEVNFKKAIRFGVSHAEIVKYAAENDIDLIVIATQGKTGLLHTLLGSVAEKVIRHSDCPVLVITPKREG